MRKLSIKYAMCAYFMAIFFFLAGCDTKTNRIVEKYPLEKSLKAKHVNKMDSLYTMYAVVTDGNNFLFSQKKKAKFFVTADNGLNITGELCPAGNGHGEWNAPIATGQFGKHESVPCAYILERSTHSLYMQPTDGNNPTLVESFKSKDIASIRYVFRVSDDSFVGALDDDKCEFFTYRKTDKHFKTFEHPIPNTEKMGNMSHTLLQTLATYNNNDGRIAICYFTFPLIVIRSSEGKIEQTIQVEKTLPQYTEDNAIEPHFYFKAIKSDSRYIYALYSPSEQSLKEYILVFSWTGDAVAKYAISPSMDFAVDSRNSRFVAIDDETGSCVEYKYKQSNQK